MINPYQPTMGIRINLTVSLIGPDGVIFHGTIVILFDPSNVRMTMNDAHVRITKCYVSIAYIFNGHISRYIYIYIHIYIYISISLCMPYEPSRKQATQWTTPACDLAMQVMTQLALQRGNAVAGSN